MIFLFIYIIISHIEENYSEVKNMGNLIGREKEINRLNKVLNEKEAQLVIIYGRRRVGKTFLVNQFFENKFDFKFTGAYDRSKQEQLKNFTLELNHQTNQHNPVPKDWTDAFFMLRSYLEKKDPDEKQIVFFDEMPWMDTQLSGFLPAFEWFWNSWGNSRDNLIFVVCGSSTSWLVDNFDHNKGGLFNRSTCRIFLNPFNLYETEKYLNSRDIYWSRYDITVCYMIMGGIPYYLRLLDRELSLNENIDMIFFGKRAELWDEFNQLFNTLFKNSEHYIHIVEALSKIKSGLERYEIAEATKLPSNGDLTSMLSNLEQSGFIRINARFGNKSRGKTYQLADYFTMFYFRFVRDNHGKDEHFWSNTTDNPTRNSWQGLTFEQVCKDHISQIKKKLGISGILSTVSAWSKKGNNTETGAQIDMLIDRRDHVISLCEDKFSTQQYEITKEYDGSLKNKVAVFRESTGTKKTIQVVMVTTYGIKPNKYSNYVGRSIQLDDLFEKEDT